MSVFYGLVQFFTGRFFAVFSSVAVPCRQSKKGREHEKNMNEINIFLSNKFTICLYITYKM